MHEVAQAFGWPRRGRQLSRIYSRQEPPSRLGNRANSLKICFYVSNRDGEVDGLSGSYVEDLLCAGCKKFRNHFRKAHNEFDMGE